MDRNWKKWYCAVKYLDRNESYVLLFRELQLININIKCLPIYVTYKLSKLLFFIPKTVHIEEWREFYFNINLFFFSGETIFGISITSSIIFHVWCTLTKAAFIFINPSMDLFTLVCFSGNICWVFFLKTFLWEISLHNIINI